jgi:general secretion pathway protein K
MNGWCTPRVRRDRGFALLIVLWAMVLLAFFVAELTLSGRSGVLLARNLRAAAVTEAAADAATNEAVFHLLAQNQQHWEADGGTHIVRLPQAVSAVLIQSEAGKVNPNSASPMLLGALLSEIGADTRTATTIAGAITTWRAPSAQNASTVAQYRAAGYDYAPPGARFQTLDEVGLVLGMTADLLQRLRPHLTLYHDGDPILQYADPVVQRAMGRLPAGTTFPIPARGEQVVSITATTRGPAGAYFVRHAIVRFTSRGDEPFQILTWDAGN